MPMLSPHPISTSARYQKMTPVQKARYDKRMRKETIKSEARKIIDKEEYQRSFKEELKSQRAAMNKAKGRTPLRGF